MRCITGDIRFNGYCVLYSRVLPIWMLFSIVVLLVVLFSSPNGGMPVLVFTCVWMFMLLLGILFCIVIRKHVSDCGCLCAPLETIYKNYSSRSSSVSRSKRPTSSSTHTIC